VDEEALREVLDSGHLAGAALDVHEREGEGQISRLAGLESVILTPHIGASTVDTQHEIGESILRSVATYQHEPVELYATQDNFIVM
jgi:phosphoglycerate dehydrogenase-like enzyme